MITYTTMKYMHEYTSFLNDQIYPVLKCYYNQRCNNV